MENSELIEFEFELSQISKDEDVTGNEDIDTHPEPVRVYKNYILPLLY
jgi:hypothetical protein